jgi:hypothetical protein
MRLLSFARIGFDFWRMEHATLLFFLLSMLWALGVGRHAEIIFNGRRVLTSLEDSQNGVSLHLYSKGVFILEHIFRHKLKTVCIVTVAVYQAFAILSVPST